MDFKLPKRALTLGQVFTTLETLKSPGEKILWLRHNDKPVLRYYLKLAIDPSIEWALPKGLPPYKPLTMRRGNRILPIKPGQAPTELILEARRIYRFLKDANTPRIKCEKMFQQMIEDMEPVEVDVIHAIKDRFFTTKFIAAEIIEAAFPGITAAPSNPRFMKR